MDRLDLLKFMLIAMALPTQYFLSQYWANNSSQQSEALRNLVDTVSTVRNSYFELNAWKKWYLSFVVDLPSIYKGPKSMFRRKEGASSSSPASNTKKLKYVEYDDDIAVEVLTYRKQLLNFGESSVTRSPRPSQVLFRVGQVIKHKKFELYGVIIGWDLRAAAPSDWIDRNYTPGEREQLIGQPHYLVLVDEKSQKRFSSKAYIAQEELQVVVNNKIRHRILNSYFSQFDGGQYLPKKFLKTVYPHD